MRRTRNGREQVSFDGGCTWLDADDGRAEAWERARSLLLEHLSDEQEEHWRKHGCVPVVGASQVQYLVYPDIVKVPGGAYCLEPTKPVPESDAVLARVLWIEGDEEGFLAEANWFPDPSRLRTDMDLHRDLYDAREEHERRLADMERDHALRREELHRRFAEEVAEIERIHRRAIEAGTELMNNLNCHCDIEFTGPLHLDTLEDARSYAARRNWHVEVNIDRHDLPSIFEAGRWIDQEPTYEVDGRPTDEMTVQLLGEVFQQREGARPDAEPTDAQRESDFLAGLPCPFHVEVREGHCS